MHFISENYTGGLRIYLVCLCQVNYSVLIKLMNCILVYIQGILSLFNITKLLRILIKK